jgi:nicotinamidase-related amidase
MISAGTWSPNTKWGSFYGTELDPLLRRRGITTLLLGGIATNLGVESAAREAHDRGYEQILIEDAATAFDSQAHHDSVSRVFSLIGRVRTAAEGDRRIGRTRIRGVSPMAAYDSARTRNVL